jgi:GNAT superfamily N-acetyltransferase
VSTEVTIGPARLEHADVIAGLLDELDRFYEATETEPGGQRVRHVLEALFSDPPSACALLAWDKGRAIGFASYSFLWPAAGSTRSLYLKELYVADDHRGEGVGRSLMDALCQVAAEHGCSRVEWTTDDDNPGAVQFYQALGYVPKPSKIFYRIEANDLAAAGQRAVIAGRQPGGAGG